MLSSPTLVSLTGNAGTWEVSDMSRNGMRWAIGVGLLSATIAGRTTATAGGFAAEVIDYQPGVGYATDWATGAGYTDPATALGEPSRVTVDPDPQWGGTFEVNPFSGPYLLSQVVSIGEGGSLTIRLGTPATDDPTHPFGLDFLIFGHSAFLITNGDYTGGGITDGSLLGAAEAGSTRVEISADGATFYELNPSLAPVADGLFPTDGGGSFSRAADPALVPDDFDGLGLPGIRALYAGSAGGAGYDLAWALDGEGNPAGLDAAQYIRVSVLSGHAEIDGFSVVPEPTSLALLGTGAAMLFSRLRRRDRR